MKNINYPVNFQFNISTLSNDFVAKDANANTIAYVKQKMFKLKEDINIYNDETKRKVNYTIKADRWLDFSAAYTFYDENGNDLGKIARKGWRSIWNATYEIIDNKQEKQFTINEENAWTKVFDSLIGGVPVLGMFTGYLFNPAYIVKDNQQKPVVKLKKLPSFFGRKFEITKIGELGEGSNERIMLGLMMMNLLERQRG